MKTQKHTNYHDFNGSKFTSDPESFISALKAIKTYGGYENATVPLHHIATSADYNWGLEQTIIALLS